MSVMQLVLALLVLLGLLLTSIRGEHGVRDALRG